MLRIFVLVALAALLAAPLGCSRRPEETASSAAARPSSKPERGESEEAPSTSPGARRPEGVLPRFVDVANACGIDFHREDDIRGLHRILEANGGGVAFLDFDADGRLDVFFTNGCRLPLKERTGESSNALFQQGSTWQFRQVTAAAGLASNGYGNGCAVGDYDGDGFDDLYVTAYRAAHLYHNNGDGTFSEVTQSAGVHVPLWNSSAAFADVNRDGHLDLYVVTYLKANDDPPELCESPGSPDGYMQCPPTMFEAEDDALFLSDGAGGFTNIAAQAGVTGVNGKGLGVVVFDADQNGWPDIFVANDGAANFLYMNRTDASPALQDDAAARPLPRFIEEALLRGGAVNELGAAEASMGVAHGDIDADGWIDVLVTNFHAEMNTLYRNLQGQGFDDYSRESGVGPPSRPYLGFGTEFFDFDNDGWLDLFVANGHVDDQSWHPAQPPYEMTPLMFRNRQGRFEDVSAWSGDYFRKRWLGRGVAVGDLDDDGDLDLAVSHQRAPSSVLRNDTATPHSSVSLRLIGGPDSNRSAFHARVEATGLGHKLVRELAGGGSFQSASDRRIPIGCGTHDSIETLAVQWPSGRTQTWEQVKPGAYLVREGDSVLWTVPR